MVDVVTRDLLREWGVCYSDKHIAGLVPECGLTPLEVCDLEDVPAKDRLWVLLRPEVICNRDLRLLAAAFADLFPTPIKIVVSLLCSISFLTLSLIFQPSPFFSSC